MLCSKTFQYNIFQQKLNHVNTWPNMKLTYLFKNVCKNLLQSCFFFFFFTLFRFHFFSILIVNPDVQSGEYCSDDEEKEEPKVYKLKKYLTQIVIFNWMGPATEPLRIFISDHLRSKHFWPYFQTDNKKDLKFHPNKRLITPSVIKFKITVIKLFLFVLLFRLHR